MHTSCYFLNKGFSAWFNYNLVGPLSSLTRHHLLCWQQWRFTWTLLTSVVLPNTTPTICTLHSNFWSQSLGELLLSQAGWRSHPLIIVIGESKARGCTVQIWSACTSTSLMPSNASQDTVINNCWNTSGPGFGENRSHLEKSGLLLKKRNFIIYLKSIRSCVIYLTQVVPTYSYVSSHSPGDHEMTEYQHHWSSCLWLFSPFPRLWQRADGTRHNWSLKKTW